MRKKRIIISIVVVICVLVGIFFIMRFGVIGKIRNAINKLVVENKAEAEEEAPEEVRYGTAYDKEGKEIVIETKKIIVEDKEGNKFEAWLPTSPPISIYHHTYLGRIEKIEDNKIYFMVDKERKEGIFSNFKKFKDYQIIFDIDTYDLCRSGDSLYYDEGGLEDSWGDIKYFYSAEELEFLVGKYLGLQDYMCESSDTGDRNKTLVFYPY